MPRLPIGALPSGTPTNTDSVLGADASDGSRGKLFSVGAVSSAENARFAEIYSPKLTLSMVTVPAPPAVFQVTYAATNGDSEAAAGDPGAGTLLTADSPNNKIVIPPYYSVRAEYGIYVIAAGADNMVANMQFAGVDVVGSFSAVTVSAGNGFWFTGSAIFSNPTALALDLTLVLSLFTGPAQFPCFLDLGFLRAIFLKDNTP